MYIFPCTTLTSQVYWPINAERRKFPNLTLLHSEWPNRYGVLAILSAKGLSFLQSWGLFINLCRSWQFLVWKSASHIML